MNQSHIITGQSNIAFLFWFVISILLLILTLILYKKRDSEQAEVLGTLGPLSSYIRAIGTLIGGTGFSAMFIALTRVENILLSLIIIFFSCLFIYHIGDIILARRVRISKKTIIASSVTSLAVTTAAAALLTGGLGFEERIPNVEDVVSVTVSDYQGRYGYETSAYYYDSLDDNFTNASKKTFEDPETIKTLIDFHTTQIESFKNDDTAKGISKASKTSAKIYERMTMEYTLASGRTMTRRFYKFYDESVAPLLELETNEEFITAVHAIYRAEKDEVLNVHILNNMGELALISLTQEEKEYLLVTLREELLNQPANEIAKSQSLGIVELTFTEENLQESYTAELEKSGGSVLIPSTHNRGYSSSDYRNTWEREEATGLRALDNQYHSEVVLTESFVKTLDFLEKHTDIELVKNPSDHIVKAYATFYGSNRSVINPYSWKAFTMSESLYSYNNRKIENDKYAYSDMPFIELDLADIDGLMEQSFDIFSGIEQRVMIVYSTKETPENIEGREYLAGATYVPLSSLPEDVREELLITSIAYSDTLIARYYIEIEENELTKMEEFIAKNIDENDNLLPNVDFSSY